jgi:ornithine--oxo-acid transaminase
VQMDCSLLSGLLAEALLKKTPSHLEAIFFCNSGTEAIEGALKFARAATGRAGIVSLHSGYHGLSYGSLSVTGIPNFQEGFGPLMADTARVKLGDLGALERLLQKRNVAAFLVEPVQGKGVKFPKNDFFIQAQSLCRKYGTLFVCDEVQTGLGRTGKWWGFEHWNLEPDIITVAKSLSGGFVPCGAIVTRRAIYQKVFSRLDRCVVHSSTFGRNNLAMACGLASLAILEDEKLVEQSARIGNLLVERLDALRPKHTFLKEIRGKGLMIAIEFHEPPELGLKTAWRLLHKIDKALFPQLVIVPLLSKHRVLTQVAGHNMDVIKILPPLMIGEREVDYFVKAFDETLAACRRFPGPMLELAMNTARKNKNGRRPAPSGYRRPVMANSK